MECQAYWGLQDFAGRTIRIPDFGNRKSQVISVQFLTRINRNPILPLYLKLTFYSFYLSNESNEIIKQAVNDDIISSNIASIIYNSGTMTYDLLYGYHDRFNDLLEKSDKLYSVQMKKPFYRNH